MRILGEEDVIENNLKVVFITDRNYV